MIRRAFCFCFVLLSLSVQSVFGGSRRDGNWWDTIPKEIRAVYVAGFFDGMKLGNSFSYWGATDDPKQKDVPGYAIASFRKLNDKYLNNVSAKQIVDGLNEFYADLRTERLKLTMPFGLLSFKFPGCQKIQ